MEIHTTEPSAVPKGIGDPRRDKFLELANRRLPEALDRIRLLENLFDNPYRYFWTNEDAEFIYKKLMYAAEGIRRRHKAI